MKSSNINRKSLPACEAGATSARQRPVAFTIAGSDSGGGAGIQADLKTFAALGVHGASAIACLTAQNPTRVLAIEPCSGRMLSAQIEAVFEGLHPAAVKTGMLFSAENIRLVAHFFRRQMPSRASSVEGRRLSSRPAPGARASMALVVDPVMISTSGSRLLQPRAIAVLKKELLPLASLVTPNLDEAEILSGRKISSVENMRAVAREIHKQFGCAALVKGGHLEVSSVERRVSRGPRNPPDSSHRMAVDIFFDGRNELLLSAPFIRGVRTHGTGCTYSAAITAALALGFDLPQAVTRAKNYITQAIAGSYRIGKHSALNHSVPKAFSN